MAQPLRAAPFNRQQRIGHQAFHCNTNDSQSVANHQISAAFADDRAG
jgi:hypothetical protein